LSSAFFIEKLSSGKNAFFFLYSKKGVYGNFINGRPEGLYVMNVESPGIKETPKKTGEKTTSTC